MTKLTESSRDNYKIFLEQVSESETVWGICNEQGWAVCASEDYEEATVIPFWSDKTFAENYIKFEWPRYETKEIPLEEFMDNWMHGMDEDNVLAGINWCEQNNGLEIEPLVLLDDLDS